jgi:serine/arginine repetitive matrix protein 2
VRIIHCNNSTDICLDFRPPRNPESMKALLQHSVQNFGPLPSELRPRRRSRTFSRPSPYPLARVSRVFHAPESKSDFPHNGPLSQAPGVLQDVHVYSNVPPSPAPSFTFRALSPEKEAFNKSPFGRPAVRPRVGSTTRRVAKRKSSHVGQKENKENKENVSTGSAKRYVFIASTSSSTDSTCLSSQGDSLRLNRPRPRGRPGTTAQPAQPRPIRI